jgi:Cys-tRNA(Pro)/Cys-tRNA(Cys) deacylase
MKIVVIMMGKKVDKTNVMRILDQKKISYRDYSFDSTKLQGIEVATYLKENPE